MRRPLVKKKAPQQAERTIIKGVYPGFIPFTGIDQHVVYFCKAVTEAIRDTKQRAIVEKTKAELEKGMTQLKTDDLVIFGD